MSDRWAGALRKQYSQLQLSGGMMTPEGVLKKKNAKPTNNLSDFSKVLQ